MPPLQPCLRHAKNQAHNSFFPRVALLLAPSRLPNFPPLPSPPSPRESYFAHLIHLTSHHFLASIANYQAKRSDRHVSNDHTLSHTVTQLVSKLFPYIYLPPSFCLAVSIAPARGTTPTARVLLPAVYIYIYTVCRSVSPHRQRTYMYLTRNTSQHSLILPSYHAETGDLGIIDRQQRLSTPCEYLYIPLALKTPVLYFIFEISQHRCRVLSHCTMYIVLIATSHPNSPSTWLRF